MSRLLVKGLYKDPKTYVLYAENGEIFQTIREGKKFTIANQFRPWTPVQVKKKKGKGTILVCRKFGNKGNIIEEFPLPQGKVGLWALTSGAARNGVFHAYRMPKNALERALDEKGVSRRIIVVDTIDTELEVGGELCSHIERKSGFWFSTDGSVEILTEPSYVPDDHFNVYHRGCMESTFNIRISGGTYVVYYEIGTHMNGSEYNHISKILLTPSADEAKVIEEIKKL